MSQPEEVEPYDPFEYLNNQNVAPPPPMQQQQTKAGPSHDPPAVQHYQPTPFGQTTPKDHKKKAGINILPVPSIVNREKLLILLLKILTLLNKLFPLFTYTLSKMGNCFAQN